MRFKNIFLDFDGTVSESGAGIFNALSYMYEKLSLPLPDEKALSRYIGPPIKLILAENGITGEAGEHAYALFREYYEKAGIFEMKLYGGIRELLEDLQQSGASVYLATAKRHALVSLALEYLDIERCFTGVFGADPANNIFLKGDILKNAIEILGFYPEDAVMVGDTVIDIAGGKENGFATIGVLYGYGEEKEILEAGPDFIARDTEALKSILLG